MFDIVQKNKRENIVEKVEINDNKESIKNAAVGITITESVKTATQEAAKIFAKPMKYDRSILDDGFAKKSVKMDAFSSGKKVIDPYTGKELKLTKTEAKIKYGSKWQEHVAEADHKISLKRLHSENKKNEWLKNSDLKEIANSAENLEVTSRQFNNAKRSRTNKDFVSDEEYLKKTGVDISKEGKTRAIENENEARKFINKSISGTTKKNIIETGHKAGVSTAQDVGALAGAMSGIMNIVEVFKGEKSIEDAIADTAVDGGKAAAQGYMMGGGLTVISHTLSNSSSRFLKTLAANNVPGKVITTIMTTGGTLKKWTDGEISTQECIIELGEKGLNVATMGYSMAVGQSIIPIPVVGAAVGALVGSMLTSNLYNHFINELKQKQLEHEERLRIIQECNEAARQMRIYREELQEYISLYLNDYKDCFDEALMTIDKALNAGDANAVILGASQITRKLGGEVSFETVGEFKRLLFDDTADMI